MHKCITEWWKKQIQTACAGLLFALLSVPAMAWSEEKKPALQIHAASIKAGEYTARDIKLSYAADGGLDVSVQSIADGQGVPLEKLQLACDSLYARGENYQCTSGDWFGLVTGFDAELGGRFEQAAFSNGTLTVDGDMTINGLPAKYRFSQKEVDQELSLNWDSLAMNQLLTSGFIPQTLIDEGLVVQGGNSSGHLRLLIPPEGPYRVLLDTAFQALDFDSDSGIYAGVGVSGSLQGEIGMGDDLSLDLAGDMLSGEVLVDDFYRDFSDGGLGFQFAGDINDDQIELSQFSLSDSDSMNLTGSASLALADALTVNTLDISALTLRFPSAYERYMQPMLADLTLDKLETSGKLSGAFYFADGHMQSGDVTLTDINIDDSQQQRFFAQDLNGRFRIDQNTIENTTTEDSRLSWQALGFYKVLMDATEVALTLRPRHISLSQPVRIPMLEGDLYVDRLSVESFPDRPQDIQLHARLQNLDMRAVSGALNWPVMAGVLSADIPGVRLSDGVLDMEGELRFEIFDGAVVMDNLSIERPFGVLPTLAANMQIDNLDLEQLTSTFSFGHIAGRMDGRIDDLRMLNWQPVAFDAWLGTRSEGERRISQRAVNDITKIGGGGPVSSLSGGLLGIFDEFSYKRLGLGCRLQNNVCHIRGLNDAGESALLVEGSGIPRINVRAFNRVVDWPQLVAELKAATSGQAPEIGTGNP